MVESTWLLSAEIFSIEAFEKKEMFPFFVNDFCACKEMPMNRKNEYINNGFMIFIFFDLSNLV
jgi:hypothetical protein